MTPFPTTYAALIEQAIMHPTDSLEFNVPAHIIMELDIAKHMDRPANIGALESFAEEGMLLIAFLNLGIKPTAAFITQAYKAGWRYRTDFYKVKA